MGSIPQSGGFWTNFVRVATASTLAVADLGLRLATKHATGEAMKLEDVKAHLELADQELGAFQGKLEKWADQVAQLESAFESLLDAYAAALASQGKVSDQKSTRFLILVDDLDRCLPETTVSILEGIKNHLSTPRCIFALALNHRIVYQEVRIKYHGFEINGREYLEKILSYSFHVPEPDPDRIAGFVERRFQHLVPDITEQDELSTYFAEFAAVLQACRFTNPRKIHRILNRYLFFLIANSDHITSFHTSNIARFMILAEYFPELFHLYLKDEETNRALADTLGQLGTSAFSVAEFEKTFATPSDISIRN